MAPHLDAGTTLAFALRAGLARGAAAGVRHLHDVGVAHCALRSAHCLLADDGTGAPVVKLSDFGALTVELKAVHSAHLTVTHSY